MKKFLTSFLFLAFAVMQAQNNIAVSPKDNYVRENLDLNEVAKIYQESTSLADFERTLNDPGYRISNLDLNNDERVDYLRVTEKVENNIHKIIIQSEISSNVYEDVASIDLIVPKRKPFGQVAAPILTTAFYIAYIIAMIKN